MATTMVSMATMKEIAVKDKTMAILIKTTIAEEEIAMKGLSKFVSLATMKKKDVANTKEKTTATYALAFAICLKGVAVGKIRWSLDHRYI